MNEIEKSRDWRYRRAHYLFRTGRLAELQAERLEHMLTPNQNIAIERVRNQRKNEPPLPKARRR